MSLVTRYSGLGGLVIAADHFEEARKKIREAAAAALLDAANELLRVANETVPYEEGVLAGDSKAEVDKEALVAQVAYGIGPAKAYALVQHEDTSFRHDPGHRAKWLELASQENAQRLGVSIAMTMRGELA